jgi:hypothetical protein
LSDGCYKIFAVTTAAGGSPGTPPDVVYSIDRGANWYAHDIEAFSTAQAASGIACLGGYVVAISNAYGGLAYADKDEFDTVSDPVFTGVQTGFVAGSEPNDIWAVSTVAFIVGDMGYVYQSTDPTAGVTVLDAGVATIAQLNAVHALSENYAVAVGNDGSVIYTTNGSVWAASNTNPVAIGVDLNCVWMLSTSHWLVGTSNGRIYYTLDSGNTWTEKAFPGSGAGVVYDIAFATASVGFASHSTAAPRARILRTYDGGHQWRVMPEHSGSLPANDQFTAIAACPYDPNIVVAGGLADDGSDGVILLGEG